MESTSREQSTRPHSEIDTRADGRGQGTAGPTQPASASDDAKVLEEHMRCRRFVSNLYRSSPLVVYLLEALGKASCKFDLGHFECVPCDKESSGAFDVNSGVKICQNFIFHKGHVEETMAHELIHAYDYCTRKFDALNCKHVACSEIRAAALSGDCKWRNEFFFRGKFNLKGQYQECVRRRAILSLQSMPLCAGQPVDSLVDGVFKACIKDTRPFLDIPY